MMFALLAVLLVGALAAPRPQEAEEPIGTIIFTDVNPEGFEYSYETADGTKPIERSSTVPEWNPHIMQYMATDDGGSVATGDAIPTPPPIPPEIQRALNYIAANPPASEGPGRGRRRR